MSIWTSKGPLAALGLLLLCGCGDAGFPLGAMPDQATRAELARGAVVVQAPPGYCIDRQALRRAPRGDFALLARCDTLGVRGFFPRRQLALLTVTTAPQSADTAAPGLADLEQSLAPAKVVETAVLGDLPMVRLETPDGPAAGIATQHWRSAIALNGQLVALALYEPQGDADAKAAGPALLADLAQRTRQASQPPQQTAPSATRAPDQPDPDTDPATATAGTGEDPGKAPPPATGGFISPFKRIASLFD